MFTGLVKEIGTIARVEPNVEGRLIEVRSNSLLPDIEIDDSVAINGVCQTAVKINQHSFVVQAVHTTLEKTSLGKLKVGEKVNLELALRPSDRLGGHFVQGHVNGMAKIVSIKNTGNNYNLRFSVPQNLRKYIVQEGSIAIEGISLTVSKEHSNEDFEVTIIPHTWFHTILCERRVGDNINIEVDMLAKYMEKILGYKENLKSSLSITSMREMGY